MLHLVDGYNVTRADDATRRLHPDDQRSALMRRLGARGAGLLGRGRIVVVWDKGHLAEDLDVAGVEAVYSLDRTADDVIVDLAEAHGGPVTVVSSDRELGARVRERAGRGAIVLGCSTLFESARPTRAKRRPVRDAYGGLPPGHAEITRELEGVWLAGEDED